MQQGQDSEEFKNLLAIFPNWNKESLFSIFESNACSLDVTVQSVLAIEAARETGNVNGPIPIQSKESKSRGTPCILPNDFLRPPGWTPKFDADEQLARNLQREMSINRKQLPTHATTNTTTTTTNNNLTSALQIEPIPDLGILKAMSIFSEKAVKNMDLFVASVQDSVAAAAAAANQATTTASNSSSAAGNVNSSTTGTRKTSGSINDDQNDNIWHDHDSDDDATIIDVKAQGDVITFDSPTRLPLPPPSSTASTIATDKTAETTNTNTYKDDTTTTTTTTSASTTNLMNVPL